MDTTRRDARPGETCTCGRKAVVIIVTVEHGDVPWCGIELARNELPCGASGDGIGG